MIETVCIFAFLGLVIVGTTWLLDKELEKRRNRHE